MRRLLIPYFKNAFSVCRTQESGSSETRQRRFKIRRPRLLPSWNQMVSAMRAAATQHTIASSCKSAIPYQRARREKQRDRRKRDGTLFGQNPEEEQRISVALHKGDGLGYGKVLDHSTSREFHDTGLERTRFESIKRR